MEYITVGTDTILREYMSDIIDTERIVKPAGGIWCTDYDVLRPQNCDWINHLIDHPGDLMMKSIGKNPFSHKAAILKVNDGAKVFTLAGNDDYDKFLEFYSRNGNMSYEALSKDYDGIYVDLCSNGVFGKSFDERNRNYRMFAVNTFLLFNIDAIDTYKKAQIDIEPFDYEGYCDFYPDYKITVQEGDHRVKELSEGYKYLFRKVVEYFGKHYPTDNVSRSQMVAIIYEAIMNLFAKDLKLLAESENLDEKRLAQTMSTHVLSRNLK